MRAFEQGVTAALGRMVHSVWDDPREEACRWAVPAEYDRALLQARVVSGAQAERVPCLPKKWVLDFPVGRGIGAPGHSGACPGLAAASFHDPAVPMDKPAVDCVVDAGAEHVQELGCGRHTGRAWPSAFSSRAFGTSGASRMRLRSRVRFADDDTDDGPLWVWACQLNRLIRRQCPSVPLLDWTLSSSPCLLRGLQGQATPSVPQVLVPQPSLSRAFEAKAVSYTEGFAWVERALCFAAIRCPPAPVRRPSDRMGVTLITKMLAEQVHLVPAELEMRRDEPLPDLVDLISVSSPREGGRRPYDLFEPERDRRTRQAGSHWSVEDLVQDAVHTVAYVVRSIQMPRRPLPRTYQPNLIMTPARAGRHKLALPVDMREVGGAIYTILVEHGTTVHEVVELVLTKDGGRLQHVVELHAEGTLRFRDSRDRRVELLVAPLTAYEWLCVYEAGEHPVSEVIGEPRVADDVPEEVWPVQPLPQAVVLYTPEPTERFMMRAASVLISPPVLSERAFFTTPTAQYDWARNEQEALGHFSIFDTQRHSSIGECGPHSDLQTLVAQAIQTAPFEVSGVQILTDPLWGYPRPQLVLYEAGREPFRAPVPWDLRDIGQGVWCVEQRPGQDLEDALRAVEQCMRPPADLVGGHANGAFAVHDSLGPVLRILPRSLESVQHFRVGQFPSQLHFSMHEGPRFLGGAQMHEGTTASTTWTQVYTYPPVGPALRLMLFRGTRSASVDLSPPFRLFDEAVAHLLAQLSVDQHISSDARVVLSGALPPQLGYLQEVPLVLIEGEAGVPYVWDARPIGGGLQVLHLAAGEPLASVLSQDWRRGRWRLAVNGVPEDHCDRPLRPGDFLQPFLGNQVAAVVPLGRLFDLCVHAGAYAWPVDVRGAGLPMSSQPAFLAQLTEELRVRRLHMGMPFRRAGRAVVMSALQGAVCLHFARPRPPGHQAVLDALGRLDLVRPLQEVTRTAVMQPDTAFFTALHEVAAHQAILAPAPSHPEHFVVLLVPNGAISVQDVPAARGMTLYPRRSLQTGDVLYLRQERGEEPEPASDGATSDGNSLLQTSVQRIAKGKVGAHMVVPTPFGRRRVPLAERGPQTLCLDECLPLQAPDAAAPREAVLHLPAPREAIELAFQGCALQHYVADVPASWELHPAARGLLSDLPAADRTQKPAALYFFLDGSFLEGRTSWAVACLAFIHDQWCWWGFLSSCLEGGLDSEGAFSGELYAQLVAGCTIAGARVPSVVGFDCTGAAHIAGCEAKRCDGSPLRAATAAIAAFLEAAGCLPARQHIKSHSGHAGNEPADGIAKAVARSRVVKHGVADSDFADYIRDGAFDWLWAFPAVDARSDMPRLLDDSSTVAVAPQATQSQVCAPADWAPDAGIQERRAAHVEFSFGTYNTLSCVSNLQRQCLNAFMEEHDLAFLGLQECRQDAPPVSKWGSCWRFASPPVGGQFGCQLWVRDVPAYGWAKHCFEVVFRHHRLLVVFGRMTACSIAFFVGHSPTATAPRAEREEWWTLLKTRIAALPSGFVPVFMLDANARFMLQGAVEAPVGPNGEALSEIVEAFGLARSRAHATDGTPRYTWAPPVGSRAGPACLDYLLWPAAWSDGVQDVGPVDILDEHAGIDHRPVLARMSVTVVRQPNGSVFDRAAMCTDQGRAKLKSIFLDAPRIPWHVSVDDHLLCLNRYLQCSFREAFPRPRYAPRRPTISQRTWELLSERRVQRRIFRRQAHLFQRWVVAKCFAAWSTNRTCDAARTCRRVRGFDTAAARHIAAMRNLTRALRQAHRHDEAEFTRCMFARARATRPVGIAKHLRTVLKSGRSGRIPAASITLNTPEGVVRDPALVKRAFADHFAQTEKAVPGTLTDARHQHDEGDVPGSCALETTPTLVQLAAAFAAMKDGKACGISQLPAEAYSKCPLQAALLHFPLLLKIHSRQIFPSLWAGILACAIPKPGKDAHCVTGYRSVALAEPAAKGVLRAVRPVLSQGLERVALPSIGGARTRHPTELAALSAQEHVARLRRDGKSGAVLYLDGTNAFYAVVRSHLFTGDLQALQAHLAKLPVEGEVKRRLRDAVGDRGALDRAGIPLGAQHLLRTAFRRTWFSTDPACRTVQFTHRGTTPGSPLADILYQFVSETAVRCLHQQLVDEGLAAQLLCGRGDCYALPQSWLDDLALLLGAPDAVTAPKVVARAASLAAQYLAVTGVEMNFAPGKSECVLVLGGAGSAQVRREVFVQGQGRLVVSVAGRGEQALRCVAAYTHLGTVRTASGSCEEALRRRAALAAEAAGPLKARIMRNAFLTCRERQDVFKAVVLARYLHGLGTLDLGTKQAQKLFMSKYVCLLRGAVKPLYVVPCRRLSDAQVCSLLRAVTPEVALHIAVVRVLGQVCAKGDPYLLQSLEGSVWVGSARQAVAAIERALGGNLGSHHDASDVRWVIGWPLSQRDTSNLLRRYRMHQIRAADHLAAPALRKAKAHQKAADMGLVFCTIPKSGVRAPPAHVCEACGHSFGSAAALGAHRAKQHGLRAASSLAYGTACEACSKQYWSTKRLRQHLRSVPECARTYLEADHAPNGLTETTASDLMPVVPLIGPRPWWAMQRFPRCTPCVLVPEDPDLVAQLPLLELDRLPDFLRDWVHAVDEGWQVPRDIPVQVAGTAGSLAVRLAAALHGNQTVWVDDGILAGVARGEQALFGPIQPLRVFAEGTEWDDM
eukprot:s90_g3.t1